MGNVNGFSSQKIHYGGDHMSKQMKKIATGLLAGIMTLTLAACGSDNSGKGNAAATDNGGGNSGGSSGKR